MFLPRPVTNSVKRTRQFREPAHKLHHPIRALPDFVIGRVHLQQLRFRHQRAERVVEGVLQSESDLTRRHHAPRSCKRDAQFGCAVVLALCDGSRERIAECRRGGIGCDKRSALGAERGGVTLRRRCADDDDPAIESRRAREPRVLGLAYDERSGLRQTTNQRRIDTLDARARRNDADGSANVVVNAIGGDRQDRGRCHAR